MRAIADFLLFKHPRDLEIIRCGVSPKVNVKYRIS